MTRLLMRAAPSACAAQRRDILEAIEAEGWSVHRAAKRLGVHRATLFRWVKILGLSQQINEARALAETQHPAWQSLGKANLAGDPADCPLT